MEDSSSPREETEDIVGILEELRRPDTEETCKISRMRSLTRYIQNASPETQSSVGTTSPEIIAYVRDSLLSPNALERKQSLFVLKSITSSIAGIKSIFESQERGGNSGPGELMLDLTYDLYLKFWTDFFVTFEVLDENQAHIIEPYLLKMSGLAAYSSSTNYISWYFVLLKKMIQHENRFIVEKGILDFFKAGHGHLMSATTKDLYFEFINTVVFPVVKSNVGWIFPEAKDFFSATVEMGVLLQKKFRENVLSAVQLVVGFIENAESGMSPLSIFFLLECLRSSLNLLSESEVLVEDGVFGKCLLIFNGVLMKRLNTMDRFIGGQIQKSIVESVCKIWSLRETGSKKPNEGMLLLIREFLGLLERESVVRHVATLSRALRSEFPYRFEMEEALKAKLTENQKIGHFRLLFIIYGTAAADPETTLKTYPYTSLLPKKSSLAKSTVEFLKCILLSEGNIDFDKGLRKFVMRNAMADCLTFWTSLSKSSVKMETEAEQVLSIQEVILKSSSECDLKMELLPLNMQVFQLLRTRSPSLGTSIYQDWETLRLFVINTALQNKYRRTTPSFCAFENFQDTFNKTELSYYGQILPKPETSFLSEFYEVRMNALTLILEHSTLMKSERGISVSILDSVIDGVDAGGPQGIIVVLPFVLHVLRAFESNMNMGDTWYVSN
jgi:hypothetical protein